MFCGENFEMVEENWDEMFLFSRVVDFISKHNFLYERPNIKFFSENLWERLPQDWLYYLSNLSNDELNTFPFKKPKPYCPETLLQFYVASGEISRLLNSALVNSSENCSPYAEPIHEVNSPVKAKKRHELEMFTNLLETHCKLHDINRIVDVGCGVGHLANRLSWNFKVVGVECNEKLCYRARKSCIYAEIIHLNVICDGTEDNQLLEILLGNKIDRTAIVSLHGCGDLQPTLLRHFCKLDRNRVPLIFTVPCCYHKMSNLGKKVFHWAMSEEVKKTEFAYNVLPVSGLRLACQKHISSWSCSNEERERHRKSFVIRAVLECLYDEREGLKFFKSRSLNRHFKDVNDVGAEFASRLGMAKSAVSQISRLYNLIYTDQEAYFTYVEPFTLLQTMMQEPMELFILLDRLFYLKENSCSACILSVFNPVISSRHFCIMGL